MKEIIVSFRTSVEGINSIDEDAKSIGLSRTAYIKKKLFQDNGNGWASTKALMFLGEISTAVNKLKYKNEDEELKPYIADIERNVKMLWQTL